MARVFSLFLAVALILVAGCATIEGNGSFNTVTTKECAFNKTGPNQDVPDQHMEAGTRLRIIGVTGDFYQVQTVSGEKGFVPMDSVGPAPDDNEAH